MHCLMATLHSMSDIKPSLINGEPLCVCVCVCVRESEGMCG